MNNFFISSLIVLLFFGGCRDKRQERSFSNKMFVGKPLVPHNIKWYQLDSNFSNFGDLFSNYRTLYFFNDSIVYMFDYLNSKGLICIDTSILDKTNNISNDTAICHYEDSILFAVENLETYKGEYQRKGNIVLCEMQKQITSAPPLANFVFKVFTDTLKLVQWRNRIGYLYKNQEYRQALDFKAESHRRLLEYSDLNK